MIFVGILLIVLGLAFAALGYLIAFRRNYALINHFVEDKIRGKFDTAYARRTGLLEILWGLISVLLGIMTLALRLPGFTWFALIFTVLGTCASLVLHTLFSIKKRA